jgi:hypothetical protein
MDNRWTTRHLADIVVLLLLLIVCLGVWKHAVANRDRRKVHCEAALRQRDVAVCERER